LALEVAVTRTEGLETGSGSVKRDQWDQHVREGNLERGNYILRYSKLEFP